MTYDSLMISFEEYLNTHNNPELSDNAKTLVEDLLLAISRAFTDCAYSTRSFDTLESIDLDDVSFDVDVCEACIDVIHTETGVLTLQLHHVCGYYAIEHYDDCIADEFYRDEGYTCMDYHFNEYKNFNACKMKVLEHELKMLQREINYIQED